MLMVNEIPVDFWKAFRLHWDLNPVDQGLVHSADHILFQSVEIRGYILNNQEI